VTKHSGITVRLGARELVLAPASVTLMMTPSAAVGMPYVPANMPVMVHQREAILTADQADDWRSGKGGGGGGVTVNIAIHSPFVDGPGLRSFIGSPDFARAFREAQRNGRIA